MLSSPPKAPTAERRPARDPTSRPFIQRTAPDEATTSAPWRTHWAQAARWTKTRPMWKQWGRHGRSPRCSIMGLPVPQDRLGGVLRYQTDHDEVGRATSCGPRTSRLMVQVLANEAIRLNIPIFNQTTGVRVLVELNARRGCVGALAISPKRRTGDNPLGLIVFLCGALIVAAGGPGELYRDSVYPRHCFGSLGLALEAGIDAVNLTESQFGIGTPRDQFPWNLSGTYVAVHALHLLARFARERAEFPRRLLPDHARAGVEHLPQGLSVAVPRDPHARLRLEPSRPCSLPGNPSGTEGLHGLQSEPASRSRRGGIQSRQTG